MGKCKMCGVETTSDLCIKCEDRKRQDWYMKYERRSLDSPQRNSLAGQYQEDMKRG